MLLFPWTTFIALALSFFGYSSPLSPETHREPTCPATYFNTCNAYYNLSSSSSSSTAPLFGAVEYLDGKTAFDSIHAAAPTPPPLPTFSSLPFLPPPTNTSTTSTSLQPTTAEYQLLLLHTWTDPFSLHLLPQFHHLSRRFPHIHFIAIDCDDADIYSFHRVINTTVTLPFPFVSTSSTSLSLSAAVSSAVWSLSSLVLSPLRSLLWLSLSSSEWWSAAPKLPPPPAAAPSLSFSSHYLVRGLPTLLLFHRSVVQQPSIRWPRSLAQLTLHIQQLTHQWPQTPHDDDTHIAEAASEEQLSSGWEGETESEGWEDEDEDEWDELLDPLLLGEMDYGLLFGVLGMSVVHWMHRLKDRMDRWEVEAIALRHINAN